MRLTLRCINRAAANKSPLLRKYKFHCLWVSRDVNYIVRCLVPAAVWACHAVLCALPWTANRWHAVTLAPRARDSISNNGCRPSTLAAVKQSIPWMRRLADSLARSVEDFYWFLCRLRGIIASCSSRDWSMLARVFARLYSAKSNCYDWRHYNNVCLLRSIFGQWLISD